MKVLVAEDDPVHLLLLQRFLSTWGYEVVACHSGDDALASLQAADAPRLALLDWMMPGLDGVEVCRKMRDGQRSGYTYLLLITSKAQKQDIVTGIEAGADDYLVKPFDAAELKARLRAGRRILQLEDELVAAQEELRQLAIRDPLTGLYNRRYMQESLQHECRRAKRKQLPLSVVMVDIDHFKHFNDALGHAAGDALLRATGQFLRNSLRASDIVCRYGGEEFTLILPEAGHPAVLARIEAIRTGIGQLPECENRAVTLSAGIAVMPLHGETPDVLLQAADQALYRAKNEGRNRVLTAHAPIAALG